MKADQVLMAADSCENRSSQCLLCPGSSESTGYIPHQHGSHHHCPPTTRTKDATVHGKKVSSASTAPVKFEEADNRKKGSKKRSTAVTRPSATKKVSAATKVSPANRRLTRSARQRRSLPLPPASAVAASRRHRSPIRNKSASKKLASEERPMRREDSSSPEPFFDLRSEIADADRDSRDVTPASLDTNVNVNANKGRPGRPAKKRRAFKRRGRKWKIIASRRAVQKAARVKTTGNQVVNFSALKPISARCSRSGMGLVVTYRPVFTESIAKRRNRKRAVSTSAVNAANNTSQRAVTRRDSGTSPLTPDRQKQDEEKSRSPGFFDQLKEVIYRPRSAQKEMGVKKWLQGIPESSSSRVIKHRSPSPTKIEDDETEETGAVHKPFTSANYSAKKSPTPGPTWNPDEFRQPVARSRSPFRMPTRHSSNSPARKPRTQVRSSRPVSPKTRSAKPKSAVAEVYAGARSPTVSPRRRRGRRPQSPASPPTSRPTSSKGWKVVANAKRKEKSPRGRPRDKADDKDHETHRVSPSVSRLSHRPAVSRSRSRTRSRTSSFTSVSSRGGHRDKDEQNDYRGKRHRHRRHHRYRHDMIDRDEMAKGPAGCNVM